MASRCNARNHKRSVGDATSRSDRPPGDLLILHCLLANVGRPYSHTLRAEPSVKRDEAAPRPPPATICRFSTSDGDPLSLAAVAREGKDSGYTLQEEPTVPVFLKGRCGERPSKHSRSTKVFPSQKGTTQLKRR